MLENKLHDLIDPAIRSMGFALWAFEIRSTGQYQALLRIYIDRADNTGVTLDDCAIVSREIGALLDVEDLIKQRYQLEVSSPGLDRVLSTLAHFERYTGHFAKIRLRAPKTGRRQLRARIDRVAGDQIFLCVDNETMTVTLSDIQRANVAL